MVYTKLGPFIDGGAPYLSAATFNAIDSGIAGLWFGTGQNPTTRAWHPTGYGASATGDPTANRIAIQAAMDAAAASYTTTGIPGTVQFDEIYPVDIVPWYLTDGTTRYGFVSLELKTGTVLHGPGGIKAKNAAYTTADATGAGYGALIRSHGASHAAIRGLVFDGNSSNQTVTKTCTDVDLNALDDVEVIGTHHLAANLGAVRIHSTSSSATCTNIRMSGIRVDSAGGIGLQCTNFDGLQVLGNIVRNTGDNCIDINGENGTSTSTGTHFEVADNLTTAGLTGVFVETCAIGGVHHNTATNCTSTGVWVNRINGTPRDITVDHNTIDGCPTGMKVLGDTFDVILDANTVRGATAACVQLGSGTGSVSYVYMQNNILNGVDGTPPLVRLSGSQALHLWIKGTKSRTSTTLPTTDAGTTTSDLHIDAVNL